MAKEGRRNIVLAIDVGKEDSLRAVQWAIDNLSKDRTSSDVYHIVHVAKLKDESPAIQHSVVGTSFHYREATKEQTEAELNNVRQYIKANVNPLLDAASLLHETHLFLEGENAPAADVAASIERVARKVQADLLVASRSNKTWSQRFFLGSVAECLAKLPFPLILVTTAPPS